MAKVAVVTGSNQVLVPPQLALSPRLTGWQRWLNRCTDHTFAARHVTSRRSLPLDPHASSIPTLQHVMSLHDVPFHSIHTPPASPPCSTSCHFTTFPSTRSTRLQHPHLAARHVTSRRSLPLDPHASSIPTITSQCSQHVACTHDHDHRGSLHLFSSTRSIIIHRARHCTSDPLYAP
jgi:hypothetical protein